jgi:predicted AlkP superfamily pyrophosphatase or phosphodiesterase
MHEPPEDRSVWESRKWSESAVRAQPCRRPTANFLVALTVILAAGACRPAEEAGAPAGDVVRTPKVMLIGIDGVRPDVLAEVATPNLDALAALGAFTARTRTTTPSVSGPSWSSMLTGVWPEKHGVTDNQFGGRRYDEYPGFLTRIEQVRPELSTFAVVDWVPLMELEGGSTAVGPEVDRRELLDGYELGWAEADTRAAALTVQHLRDSDPDALFVYLGNPDETSHETGAIGTEYRDAIALADEHVGSIVSAIRGRATYPQEDWLVVVSTDHGRRPDGGHGGDSPEEMTTFILVSGPSVASDAPDRDTFIVDVGVTALAHLGIELDPAWGLDGQPWALR